MVKFGITEIAKEKFHVAKNKPIKIWNFNGDKIII